MGRESVPRLVKIRVGRRRFLGLAAAAVGAAASACTAVLWPRRSQHDEIPVQNPAFRAAPAEKPGHVTLFCYASAGQPLAYDLNPAARAVWDLCAQPATKEPAGRTVAEISMALADRLEPRAVAEFVDVLKRAGLVYLWGSGAEVYYEYQPTT